MAKTNIEVFNCEQVEMRKGLPNLYVAIEEYQKGNHSILEDYFYKHRYMDTNYVAGNKVTYDASYIKFWDKGLNGFLVAMKKKYSRGTSVGQRESYNGMAVNITQSASKFEEDDIDALFFNYIKEFASTVNLEQFKKSKIEHTLNALRKYIKIQFENNVLKEIYNERMGVDRVMVEGKEYYVKTQEEEVFFDDVYVGQDSESGESIRFEDVLEDEEPHHYNKGRVGTYIEENYEDVLTAKQVEKFNILAEHIKENGVGDLFQKHDQSKFNKAELARILFPDREPSSCVKELNSFLASMQSRMSKALVKDTVMSEGEDLRKKRKPTPKKPEKIEPCYVYSNGFTQEEWNRYFKSHCTMIITSFNEKALKFVDNGEMMIPNINTMLLLSYEDYKIFTNGNLDHRMSIIQSHYNPKKFNLQVGKRELVKVLDANEQKELRKQSRKFISESELRELRA
jgi:hypothetical protein